jgi:hypothetical protein
MFVLFGCYIYNRCFLCVHPLAYIVQRNYECQARSERTSTKEKKTLNNMKECNKQGAREHKQCVRK